MFLHVTRRKKEGRRKKNPHLASTVKKFGGSLVGVLRVSGGCLDGVWMVSAKISYGCLECVWMVSAGYLWSVGFLDVSEGQVRTGFSQERSGQDRSGQVNTGHVKSGQVKS